MLFSSTIFIFIFLPILLLIYYIIPKRFLRLRNLILLLFSLGFYAYGEPKFIIIMILSIIGNYIFGILIDKYRNKRLTITTGITFNILILVIFKYLNFIIYNINNVFEVIGITNFNIKQTAIVLPIGISFFTFQAISYLVDVYRRDVEVQKNPFYLGMYISFFPQLIAGPIVRYSDINLAITNRIETVDKFNVGIKRFIFGLGKKVIIANNMALIADYAFSSGINSTTAMAWLGAIAYTLQIFFDFSGYSDMAIGLGKMFGFDYHENFNYPYISKSISEFWRRWHISLGSWFRDYVYFPLGGSRVDSKVKLVRNLFIVWLLTGIWHGASWNFIFWGLMYFILITFEKLSGYPDKFKYEISKFLYRIFTMLSVIFGWVVFRAKGMTAAVSYLKNMVGIGTKSFWDYSFLEYFMENRVILLAGILLSIPIITYFKEKLRIKNFYFTKSIEYISCGIILIISVSYLVIESYNPFIYFNF